MTGDFEEAVAALEAALEERPASAERLGRALFAVPLEAGGVPSGALRRLWSAGTRILGVAGQGPPPALPQDTTAAERAALEDAVRRVLGTTMFDVSVLERSRLSLVATTTAGASPWDAPTARAAVAPFLSWLERRVAEEPTVHVPMVWYVLAAGRAPFPAILSDWVGDMEARGLGVPGLVPALEEAGRLLEEIAARRFDGAAVPGLTARLDDADPVTAWAAATWLGRCLDHGVKGGDGPRTTEILARIATARRSRRTAAAAFACAVGSLVDPDLRTYPHCREGALAELAFMLPAEAGFDLEAWVLSVLESAEADARLPMAEPFAELVAERYERDPAFAARLLDAGHAGVALGCAVRRQHFVPGMEAVLERLARDADATVAALAAAHLAEHYGPDAERDPTGFAGMVRQLERAVDAGDPDAILDAWRALEMPARPDRDHLRRFIEANYRVLGIGAGPAVAIAGDADGEASAHLAWVAEDFVARTLYDAAAEQRARIRERIARAAARGRAPSRWDDESHLPAELEIPFTAGEMRALLAPFLGALGEAVARQPTIHLKLLWNVWRDGYPPSREAVLAWADELDAAEVGDGRTRRALSLASALHDEVEAIRSGDAEPDLAEAVPRILPLLDDPHPLVEAQAHRWLGAVHGHVIADDAAATSAGLPTLAAILSRLATRATGRARAAGAFVDGFGEGAGGLHELCDCPELAGFDFEGWAIEILRDADEPYVPGAQAFWFYVHEAWCDRPDLAHRLIDAGNPFAAFACATELDPPAPGMDGVLRRLAAGDDPEMAAQAGDVLARLGID